MYARGRSLSHVKRLRLSNSSAPGVNGTFVLASPLLGTVGDAGNEDKGGPTGPPATVSCSTATGNSIAAPGPTKTGIVASCNQYAISTDGIGCLVSPLRTV